MDLTPEILKVANDLIFYELHDRLILSTAKWLDIPIISSDEEFKQVKDIQVLWD